MDFVSGFNGQCEQDQGKPVSVFIWTQDQYAKMESVNSSEDNTLITDVCISSSTFKVHSLKLRNKPLDCISFMVTAWSLPRKLPPKNQHRYSTDTKGPQREMNWTRRHKASTRDTRGHIKMQKENQEMQNIFKKT